MPLTVRQAQAFDLPQLLLDLDAAHASRPATTLGVDLMRFAAWLQNAPDGCRTWIALDDAGLVAHLTAVPRATRVGNDRRRFAELVGGWSTPRRRRGLRRDPDLCRVAAALFEAHQGVDGDLVYHGCLDRSERRLAHAQSDFKPVGTLPLLQFDLRNTTTRTATGIVEADHFDARFTRLDERCAAQHGAATVRDAAFLQHRFGAHPAGGFHTLTSSDKHDELRGYAVLRRSAAHRTLWLLWDWLVPLDDAAAGEQLLHAARTLAATAGATTLAGFVPAASRWFERLQDAGASVRPWAPFLFARTSARRYDSHYLHEHWWHTLADSVLEPTFTSSGGTR